MIFVRGIMGNVKLNPAIKLWGGLILVVFGGAWGIYIELAGFRQDVTQCQAEGGVWVGGMMPLRVGALRALSGYCDQRPEAGNDR